MHVREIVSDHTPNKRFQKRNFKGTADRCREGTNLKFKLKKKQTNRCGSSVANLLLLFVQLCEDKIE